MNKQKMRAEKLCRTPVSELQTEPYSASYGQKPFWRVPFKIEVYVWGHLGSFPPPFYGPWERLLGHQLFTICGGPLLERLWSDSGAKKVYKRRPLELHLQMIFENLGILFFETPHPLQAG